MLVLDALAKLNLALEVLGRRADGFHEVRSVLQTISLKDTLYFETSKKDDITSDMPGWVRECSLITETVALLRRTTGCTKGASIRVSKRIPLSSGLGGDSSDAAATLRGLNVLWELGLPREKQSEMAAQLGSDVPFLLHGGTALVRGRGEVVVPLPPLPQHRVVLLFPPIPPVEKKTEHLYASLLKRHFTSGQIVEKLAASLMLGGSGKLDLFNIFERVAGDVFWGLDEFRRQFREAGAREVHLAGSGPTLFTLTEDKILAEKIYNKLQQNRLESYLEETLNGYNIQQGGN